MTGKSDSLTREQAQMSQVEVIFERVITELVQKMREMNVSTHQVMQVQKYIVYTHFQFEF